jgi:hypothetical protein
MAPQTRVKERAEEQSSAMSADQQAAIRMVANDLHRLNQSVMRPWMRASRWNSCAPRATTAATATGETS